MIHCLPAPSRKPHERSNPNPEVGARCRRSVTLLRRSTKMKRFLLSLFVLSLSLTYSSCVSVWITGVTGKRITFDKGALRAEVISALGQPRETLKDVDDTLKNKVYHKNQPITYADVHSYQGKINAVDEGEGQAIVNALTSGTGEVVMIPLTMLDIVKRSVQLHDIYALYNQNDRLEGVLIDPYKR